MQHDAAGVEHLPATTRRQTVPDAVDGVDRHAAVMTVAELDHASGEPDDRGQDHESDGKDGQGGHGDSR